MPIKATPHAVAALPGMTSLRDWFRPFRAGGLGPVSQLAPVDNRPIIPVFSVQTPLRDLEYFDKKACVDFVAEAPSSKRRYLGA